MSSVYARSSTSSCLYQVINIFRLYQVINDSLLITGESSYSHQWPGCGGRFLGRYNADEWFWAICVSGAWASAIHAYGRVLGSE